MIFIITYQTLYRYSISQTFSILNNPSFAAWIGQYIAVDTLKQKLDGLTGMAVWSEELARYIFIWISYLAIPLAIRQRTNIRVDIIYDRLNGRIQAISWIIIDLCLIIFSGFVFWKALSIYGCRWPCRSIQRQCRYHTPFPILFSPSALA